MLNMQTNLKTDNFCSTNQETSIFYWLFQPGQYNNTYAIGEVGVPAGSNYIRSDVIDVSSFLSGRDDILSKCMPPTPDLSSLNEPQLVLQPKDSNILLPKYTKELRSANALDSIDYNRWQTLPSDPQNLRYVIEDFANDRQGLDTRNFTKSAWNNQNKSPTYDANDCRMTLNPNSMCGPECAKVSGYPGVNPLTGMQPDIRFKWPGKPPTPDGEIYPFTGVTSQQVNEVGASACGSQFFYGTTLDQGSCPPSYPQVFKDSFNKLTFKEL